MDEPMMKIPLAAKALDVSHKTLYNWIEDGTLRLAHPGYVHLSEARRAQIKKMNDRSEWGKVRSKMFFRDGGRFTLLMGGLNQKRID